MDLLLGIVDQVDTNNPFVLNNPVPNVIDDQQ